MYREQRRTNSSRILKEVGASQKWRCNMCGDLLKSTFQLDHRIPLHKGGSNDVSNFQALCCECHAKKTQEEKKKELEVGCRPYVTCTLCKCNYSPYFFGKHKCSKT